MYKIHDHCNTLGTLATLSLFVYFGSHTAVGNISVPQPDSRKATTAVNIHL